MFHLIVRSILLVLRVAKESHQDRYSGQPGAEVVEHFRGDQDQPRIFRKIETYVKNMRLNSKPSKE